MFFIYLWCATSGTLTTWDSPTRYYADLARGFVQGKLYLPTRDFQVDYTVYQGRYYLYWGPVPAILLALLSPFRSGRVGDLQLTFAFAWLTSSMLCLTAIALWDRFFVSLPRYLLWCMLPVLSLASPAAFMLNNYMAGRIYEASITAGQFFLAAGMLAALCALRRPASRWWLALAGTLWALAIGARWTLLVPVGILLLLLTAWMVRPQQVASRAHALLPALLLPVALGLAGLGWYNWARFGSVLESGNSYQRNEAGPQFKRPLSPMWGPVFILQNAYNYALNPVEVQAQFPYLRAQYGRAEPVLPEYGLPSQYGAQQMVGALYSAPFIVFALAPMAAFLRPRARSAAIPMDPRAAAEGLNWLMLSLGAAGLGTLAVLLSFFWAAARYAYDATSLLMPLAVVGFWWGFRALGSQPGYRTLYTAIGLLLAAISVVVSTLLAISAVGAV